MERANQGISSGRTADAGLRVAPWTPPAHWALPRSRGDGNADSAPGRFRSRPSRSTIWRLVRTVRYVPAREPEPAGSWQRSRRPSARQGLGAPPKAHVGGLYMAGVLTFRHLGHSATATPMSAIGAGGSAILSHCNVSIPRLIVVFRARMGRVCLAYCPFVPAARGRAQGLFP